MQYPAKSVAGSPLRKRKISRSVDEGLNLLLSNRPLPDIPSEESDVDDSDSVYEEPLSCIMRTPELPESSDATSAVGQADAIYDVPPPGIRPATEDQHGKFKTPGVQLKAWSHSELRAECSTDKDSGSEDEQDLEPCTTAEDKLGCSATFSIPTAGPIKQ